MRTRGREPAGVESYAKPAVSEKSPFGRCSIGHAPHVIAGNVPRGTSGRESAHRPWSHDRRSTWKRCADWRSVPSLRPRTSDVAYAVTRDPAARDYNRSVPQSACPIDAPRPCPESSVSECPPSTRSIACQRFQPPRPKCSPRDSPSAAAAWPPTRASPWPAWAERLATGGASATIALGERILAELAAEGVDVGSVRRIAGCVSPSAAILVDDDGERLVCAYNDPALDRDPSWLPLADPRPLRRRARRRALARGRPRRFRRGRAARRPDRLRRRHRTSRRVDGTRPMRATTSSSRSPGSAHATGIVAARAKAGGDGASPRGASSASRWAPTASCGGRRARSAGLPAPRINGRRYAGRRRCLARRLHAGAGRRSGRRHGRPLRQCGGGDQVLARRWPAGRADPRRGDRCCSRLSARRTTIQISYYISITC